ncbi:hypothetical protein K435DRAFT_647964 [Dendrothele bispora CBS 962.96]|uniref:Uncharacterized protein n=1 Tax=Dendrothele bispora (strain CBS 962.96) TaxID=1314807 RepID=A0A4S8MQQ0_DENBC|nr:hypothetical protein K435DRAFT_647964 [Dendrothele bispora CBS 962.96]
MPKLHLKRTPEEEAARQWRKQQKKEAKRRRKHGLEEYDDDAEDSAHRSRKKSRRNSPIDHPSQKWDSEDEDFIGPQPEPESSSSKSKSKSKEHSKNAYDPYSHAYKPDYDSIRAEVEDQRFREKLSMAFEDDERLDSVEARFNAFAHVPRHWGGGSAGQSGSHGGNSRINYDDDDFMRIDPMTLDEEEYVEWIRAGMYRKTHAQEYEEKERKKAERAAKRAQEKAFREESERLEKEAAEERRRRKQEREFRKWDYAREEYNERWKQLLAPVPAGEPDITLGFDDVPWPIASAQQQKPSKKGNSTSKAIEVSLNDLTRDAISLFLFSTTVSSVPSSNQERSKKDRKDKLRETFLRFHPDKFEGRVMPRVKEDERDRVRQALGIVVRALNDLMEQG